LSSGFIWFIVYVWETLKLVISPRFQNSIWSLFWVFESEMKLGLSNFWKYSSEGKTFGMCNFCVKLGILVFSQIFC
jgi:hypothetical protein